MHVLFLLNMEATISQHVMINHERICRITHFGVQLMKTTKVLEYAEIVVPKVSDTLNNNHRIVLHNCILCLLVCRLSSGSACNIYGTNNCSTTLCNCKIEYEGEFCQNCNWREFSFVSSRRIDGTIDPINGYGVTCQKGISHCIEICSWT